MTAAMEQPPTGGRAGLWRSRISGMLPSHGGALIGDSLIYLIGAGLVGAGSFILLPLYTRSLSAANFGFYSLLDVTILIVVTITQLGLGISYLKWFADLDPSLHGELLGSAAAVSLLSSIVGGVLMFGAASHLASIAAIGQPLIPWLLMLVVPIEGFQALLLADLRARRRPLAFCVAALLRLLIMAASSIWFVQMRKMDITGVMLGRVIGGGAGVLMLAALSMRFAAPRVNPVIVRKMLGYGLPLVWSGMVGVGLDASGRYLLARYTGLEQVAVYTLALKISNVLQVGFLQPFGTAWNGMMFQIARDRDSGATVTRILSGVFVLAMSLAAIISILSPALLPFFGGGIYAGAARLIPWLLLPTAFRILEYWSSLGLYVGHRTGLIALISTGGAVFNTAGIFLLVPRFGAFGAALAWALSVSAMVIAYARFSQRFYPLPYNWRALFLGLGLWSAGALGADLVPAGVSLRSFCVAGAASLAVLVPLLWYGMRRFMTLRGVAI